MNDIISTKYELTPEIIEKRSLDLKDSKYFQEIYDFMRVKKIKRKLRSLLNINEKVLILAERLLAKRRT